MNHPLDGARLKVVRAQEHLDAFKAESAMWLQEQPNEIVSQPTHYGKAWINNQPLPESHLLPAVKLNIPPIRLSTIVGDVVTNARAALDYIISELAIRYFVPPYDAATATRQIRTAVSFPIRVGGSQGYETGLNRLKQHFGPKTSTFDPTFVLDQIKASQTDMVANNTLGWLDHLVNTDKHRNPLLATLDFDHVIVTINTAPTFLDTTRHTFTHKVLRNRDTPTPIGTMISNVPMKGEAPLYIAFQDVTMPREPTDRLLAQIVETVANIIPRFDGFFP